MNEILPPEPPLDTDGARPADPAPPSVLALFAAAAQDHPSRPAMRFDGRATSYRDLARDVAARATALSRLGLGPGARLGLLLPNCPPIITYALAAATAGAAAVPLDPTAADDLLAQMVVAMRTRTLVTSDLATVHAKALALVERGLVDRVIVVSHTSMLSSAAAVGLRLFAGYRLARTPLASAAVMVAERDILAAATGPAPPTQPPTAGLDQEAIVPAPEPGAAAPPPAALSHRAIATNLAQVLAALPALTPAKECILAAVPLCQPLSLSLAANVAIARAAELVIPEDMTTASIARTVRRARPTIVVAAPALLEAMLASEQLATACLGGARFVLTAGGPVSDRLRATHAAAAKSVALIESYGVGAAIAAITPATPAGGAACLLVNTRGVVRDLADPAREVPRGERGALYVAGPQFADGSQFQACGDLGLIDGEGRIVVVDRIEDLIVAAGYMIYPSRIETALLDHPNVADAAVIGVGCGRRGNAPKAFVVLRRGAAVTERDVRLHLASRISKIEMPADIDFVIQLPRTAFGGVCKRTLRGR